MHVRKRKWLLHLIFFGLIGSSCQQTFLHGQSTYQLGILPGLNISSSLSSQYSLNFSAESRLSLIQGEFSGTSSQNFKHVLTDISMIGSKKLGLLNKLSLGYQIRFRDGQAIHRLIQQFAMISRLRNRRLGHRFAADQTFIPGEEMELRIRYRITSEFPVSGDVVDPTEFYIKLNNEYLNSFQADDYDLEIRLAPYLGYVFSDNNKIETGLEYRLSSFINNSSRNHFWFRFNWYVRI